MNKVKEIYTNISNKIKKSNLARLINSKAIIKGLNDKIGALEIEKNELNSKIRSLTIETKKLEELSIKIPSMELIIESSDKAIKSKITEIKQLREDKIKLECELFDVKNDLISANIQKEEYEAQIKDLKSDRYLIRKIPSGKTPNTIKTKVSRGMSANVTKYMRGEHE